MSVTILVKDKATGEEITIDTSNYFIDEPNENCSKFVVFEVQGGMAHDIGEYDSKAAAEGALVDRAIDRWLVQVNAEDYGDVHVL